MHFVGMAIEALNAQADALIPEFKEKMKEYAGDEAERKKERTKVAPK